MQKIDDWDSSDCNQDRLKIVSLLKSFDVDELWF